MYESYSIIAQAPADKRKEEELEKLDGNGVVWTKKQPENRLFV